MTIIDLRSDTVTHPTPAMRRAMAEAPVGDDVYGEDPTVNELEALACRMTGKEAAVFVASGTMGNACAVMAHTQRGDEVLCGARSHLFLNEQGGAAVHSAVQLNGLWENEAGELPLDEIVANIRTEDEHHPITRLICVENTHNVCGGLPLSPEYMLAVGALAREHNLKLHVDGARIFNAAVAQNVSAETLLSMADSVTFCLSKGLCAPVGSVLCGDADFIRRARRARKLLGGGMRQAGIIAAAGVLALTSMVERLENDHADARRLGEGLANIEGITLNPGHVATNMVYFDLAPDLEHDAASLYEALAKRDVLLDPIGPRRFRAVTHYWVTAPMVAQAIAAVSEALATPIREA
ncbi:MAG: low-specificity L-threonine aldolase [Anaerolineales bacterium]